ncbi:MAG: protein kinase [Nostocaceae cyanobacterium]|nr:protein kinase [Nostocaceae cyanobacterium]
MQYWKSGQTIDNGRFTIEKVLGGGDFGVTYSAREQCNGKLVVIKTLNHLQQVQADFQQRQVKFVNEAVRLAKCSHPHIVQVYEVIEEGGLWGMVMEYINGTDLAVYLEKQGKLSESEALRYVQQVGQALEYVHRKGFLHRDVKPSNIILRRSTKEAVLIDFWLNREFTVDRTRSTINVNTEGYAAIEQYEKQGNFGAYTDVYALAATLYSLLTGKVAIPANFRKYAQLRPPKQFNPNISDRVNNAILEGMELEPQDRPQTVRKWLGMLNLQNPSPNLSPNRGKAFNTPVGGLSLSIPTRRFEFEYAKIDKSLKITRYREQAGFFIEDLGNGVVLEMVAIPGGTFLMGSPEDEEAHTDMESPQHQVTVQPFFIRKSGENPAYARPGMKTGGRIYPAFVVK